MDINIDATSLRASACSFEWYSKVVSGYRNPLVSADIVYGVAVHKFIDTMFKTSGNLRAAKEATQKAFNVPKVVDPKKKHMENWSHVFATCLDYWDRLAKEQDFEILQLPNGEPATEVTFRFKYRTVGDVTFWLCGTMDKIGKFKGGIYAIGDYKTTSAWDKRKYLTSYELSTQLRFYRLALKWMALNEPESMLGKIGATNVGVFVDALFIKPVAAENEYARTVVETFSEMEMVEFERLLQERLDKFAYTISTCHTSNNTIRPNREGLINGSCQKLYGKCDFWNVCKNDSVVGQVLLNRDFIVKPYDPLHFND